MNERVGAHRFEGPTGETIEISLFRNRITTRRGSGAEPKVKACPNVDDALKQWKRTLAQMHATMREVSLPIEGTRTVVVKSGRDTITLRVVGYDLFEDRTSMPGGPSPLFALSSHAEALEMLEDRVESFTRYGDKVLSDVSETSAKPEVNPVIPPLDLPEVKWSKNSVVVDLAEDSGRWSSLAAIVTELGKSERAEKTNALVLRADSKRDPHSLRDALGALGASPLASRLEELELCQHDDGGLLGLGDVSKAWGGLPNVQNLSLDCRGGASKLGTLKLPKLYGLTLVTDQPRLPKELMTLRKLRWLRIEATEPLESASINALWKWLDTLELWTLMLRGPFVPQVVPRLAKAKWLTELASLELVSTGDSKWPPLDEAKTLLEKVPEVTVRVAGASKPLMLQRERRRRR